MSFAARPDDLKKYFEAFNEMLGVSVGAHENYPNDEDEKKKLNAALDTFGEESTKLVTLLQKNNGNTPDGIRGMSGIFEKLGASLADISATIGAVSGDAEKALGEFAGNLDSMMQMSEPFLRSVQARFEQMSDYEKKLWQPEYDAVTTMFANMKTLHNKAGEMGAGGTDHTMTENPELEDAAPSPAVPDKNKKREWVPDSQVDRETRKAADLAFLEAEVQANRMTEAEKNKILADKYGNDNANAANAGTAAPNTGANNAAGNTNDSAETSTSRELSLPQEGAKVVAQKASDENQRALQAMAVNMLVARGESTARAVELFNTEIKGSIDGLAPGAVAENAVRVATNGVAAQNQAITQQQYLEDHRNTQNIKAGMEPKANAMATALAAAFNGDKPLASFAFERVDRANLGDFSVVVPGGKSPAQSTELSALPPRYS